MKANRCAGDGRTAPEKILAATKSRHGVVLIACMVLLLPLLILVVPRPDRSTSFDWIGGHIGATVGSAGSHQEPADTSTDELLGGLLSGDFPDEPSCRSRQEASSYWKASSGRHRPSPYLVQRLRRYEALHKRCGPNSELFRGSIGQLKSSSNKTTGRTECSYVVWMPWDGLGNRIISIASTFLYALLNNKILLLDIPDDFHGMLCEPFPGSSWTLPSQFPIDGYKGFDAGTPQSYGNMVRDNVINADMDSAGNVSLPNFAYINLRHDCSEWDRRFFCEESQLLLQRLPWLLLRSNQYFAPALFLVSQYAEELDRLFPEKETVFHHLARYLVHPSDLVWGYVTRFYEAYLAGAEERVGIQIRTFHDTPNNTFEHMAERMINCSLTEKLLPDVDLEERISRKRPGGVVKHKAVLVTNLNGRYSEKLRDMYYKHPTVDGEVISVHQPSKEEVQHSELRDHNVKALSEMYLLSFSDVLVTSAWSTFGYVAQGLSGLRSWVLLTDEKQHPVCSRSLSMEPCYHTPWTQRCKAHWYRDKGAVVPHVRHCDDADFGIKVFG